MKRTDSPLAVFLAGVSVGAVLVWWLDAGTRKELRAAAMDFAGHLKGELIERGKESLQVALEQGIQTLEKQRP